VQLRGLRIADDPATWADLGFAVVDDHVDVGGVRIALAGRGAGEGILGWTVDGLRSTVLPAVPDAGAGVAEHPNGICAVDHVVALTGDMDATLAALAADGLEPRRIRDVPGGDLRQAFFVLGTALLELGGPVEGEAGPHLWGVTLVASNIDALAARLGPLLGAVRDAVQPGRRIATLRREACSSVPLAFITPR
jgi:hypothetical protein